MSLLILLQQAQVIAGASYQTSIVPYYNSNTGKFVLREVYPGLTIGNSVFQTNFKADLRDTFTGSLNQTQASVGAVRGYGTKRNNL
jgi:hypothetical protein